MKLRYRFYAADPTLGSLTGKTIRFKPHNNHTVSVDAIELVPPGAATGVGEFQVVIDPSGSNWALVSRTYDIYVADGVTEQLIYSDRNIGEWQWIVRGTDTLGSEQLVVEAETASAAYLFTDLTDVFGEALPTQIPNVVANVSLHKTDRLCFITDLTTSGFTMNASSTGDTNMGLIDMIFTVV